ncbi:MAG: M56 and MltD domain-containing protein [Bacteriovoracia bacterium]
MLAVILSSYLALNVLVLLAWGILVICTLALKKAASPISASALLRLHYFTLPLLLACTLASSLIPGENFRPAARVWSASSMRNFNQDYQRSEGGGFLRLNAGKKIGAMTTHKIIWAGSTLGTLLLLALALRLSRDLRALARIRKRSFLVKKIHGISITTNDEITVPFTYWIPGELTVVLPTGLLGSLVDYKIAITHELQHHRQRDTLWIYAIWLLRTSCAVNPAAHLWARWMMETQEFACDETLVDRKKVDSQAYARCLVTVAQTANRQNFIPACATGLLFLAERNILRRRIESMKNVTRMKHTKLTALALGAILLASLGATSYAAKGLVQDRRVTMAQAEAMQAIAQKDTTFPIVVNDLVLKQLNRFLGTAEGRNFMRQSLQRMKNFQGVVGDKLEKYKAPAELMAVPIVESGYQNLEQPKSGGQGAGLWQFIPSTARVFGMRVDEKIDERLNVEMETDAGIRYLSANNLQFRDWQLALMAYNMGERSVQKAIVETGSRDAWKLVRAGYENDTEYLARVTAVIIILKNPGSVD